MSLKAAVILAAFLSGYPIVSIAMQSSTETAAQNTSIKQTMPWKAWRTDDNLSVSYRASGVKNLLEIKAQATLESSIAGFIYFIEDLEKISSWLDNAESAKIIKQISANENVFMTRFKGLWPVSAREMVVHSRYWQNRDLSVEILVQDAGDTFTQSENTIRMQVINAHWQITPTKPNQITISYQFIVDPKGNIPQWLTKPITLKGIWTTLNNIRDQLPNSKWQQHTKEHIRELN